MEVSQSVNFLLLLLLIPLHYFLIGFDLRRAQTETVFLAHHDSLVAACCLQVRITVIVTEEKLP